MNPLVNLPKNRHVYFTISTVLYTKETFNIKITEISHRKAGNSNTNYKRYFWNMQRFKSQFHILEKQCFRTGTNSNNENSYCFLSEKNVSKVTDIYL